MVYNKTIMLQFILKVIGIFLVIYLVWALTGGPQRGAEREQSGTDSILIGIEKDEEAIIELNTPDEVQERLQINQN